jgi:IMP dehydrogenase
MSKIIETATGALALTFDDVLLQPGHSEVMPGQTDVRTRIAGDIELNVPILSAAMDTVTEARLAIAMAQAGGIGVIHRNLSPVQQAEEVRQVKKFESGMVVNPVTIGPDATLADAQALMRLHRISGIPVVMNRGSEKPGRLVGILTNRDVRFASDPEQKVSELMTKDNLVTVRENVEQNEAKRLLHQRRIEKLLVVDEAGNCVGLITVKDIEKSQLNPNASKDAQGRLRVAAATSVGDDGFERAERLIDAGVDLLVIDTAHGHSQRVLDAVTRAKKLSNSVRIMAGNVATAAGTRALIDAGADAVKVGVGPGGVCTTRLVAGVGVPQLTAINDCAGLGIPVIADGGIRQSGDIAKALAAGASTVMIGSLFAGTDESPGEIEQSPRGLVKTIRGMASFEAVQARAERAGEAIDAEYFEQRAAEGVSGSVPYRGKVGKLIGTLMGGVRSAMSYCDATTIEQLWANAEFIRVTPAGLHESHPHATY